MRKRSANVATANVLSVRKRSDSNNEATHRTPPGSSALHESEASAANVLSVRKRSVSGKCFLCESVASATNVFCAKA
ncbi:hypothetical protein ACQKMV_20175 [Lysinibacillus sp. NPDC094403]|uniref:hypothetical protein n=1 Tax=Lysinibacillus sp. NPDC094403 TaxID=3390581 RepID=UPI003CFD1105